MEHRILTTVVLLSLLSGAVTTTPATPETGISVSAGTAEQRSMATWAIERYEMAGLVLPPLDIVFAEGSHVECNGNPARTSLLDTPTVVMCWDERPFILLHELAHVWVARNVPPANHETFMAMRDDVQAWAGADVPWRNRGSEHAANVIAWGLVEVPYPDARTGPTDKTSLREAFVFLTGAEPLHDGELHIAAPDRDQSSRRASPPITSGR